MKKNNLYILAVAVVSTFVLAACANLKTMQKRIDELGAKAEPNPLEVHGDSIEISISGRFPEKYFPKKVVAESTPVLTYSGGEAKFKLQGYQGEKAAGNYEAISYKGGKSFSYTDKIAYAPSMEESKLELRINGSMGKKSASFPPIAVADGVITTPYLMKADDKVMFAADQFVRTKSFTTEAVVNFDYNSSVLKPKESSDADMLALAQFFTQVQANPKMVITKIEFQSYASPEGEIFLNDNLAGERAESGKKALGDLMKKNKMENFLAENLYQMNPKGEDWEGFRSAMQASGIQDRDIIIRILEKTTDLNSREQEIKNISKTYLEIQKDIFPALRRCIIRVYYNQEGYSDAELKTLSSTNPAALDYEELMKAATLTEDLTLKASIYKEAQGKSNADWRATNNLGSVLFQQGKSGDAEAQWTKAYGQKKEAATSNNMGVATRVKGDRKKALTLFKESGSGEAKYNQGLIHIQNGDYASAVSAMSGYKTFNSALAKTLNGDLSGASADLAASSDNSAIADYLKAIIAARGNDTTGVGTNAKSAISKDPSLGTKAAKDLEFRNFRDAIK